VASPWQRLTIVLAVVSVTAAILAASNPFAPERALDQSRMVPPANAQGPAATSQSEPEISSENAVEDGTFGKQVVLKEKERPSEFFLTGDVSGFYTSNAALTRDHMDADVFLVASAAFGWNHAIGPELQLQIGGHVAIFRYNDRPDLDFDSFGAGVGLSWTPAFASGTTFFTRYDATKLLDRDGNDLLTEHEFTIGGQRIIALSRAHALSFTVFGGASISDPHSAQRDTIAGAIGYHLRVSRHVDLDAAYRGAVYFYNAGSRTDYNGLESISLGYHFTRWSTLAAYGSFGSNRSNHSVFDYDAGVIGGGLNFSWQF
jgi:hypothetical protein